MATPSSSLSSLRPDLAASFEAFDLEAEKAGYIARQVMPTVDVASQAGNFGKIPLAQLLQQRNTVRSNGSGKGSHAAIKSGMLAAEAAYDAITLGRSYDELTAYPDAFKSSWLHEELHKARNFKPWMSKGLYTGTLMVGIDQVVFGGKAPWTLHHDHADHETLRRKSEVAPIQYPKPDGVLTFDRLSSVFISNTNHEENQPVHLTLKDASVPVNINLELYDAPEQRYCPAGVYEIVRDGDGLNPRLQINAQNCVHCKTCDIKDPTQNINWVVPEGGGGPNYPNM